MDSGNPIILLTHELQTRLKRFVTERICLMDVILNCIKLGLEVMEKKAQGYSVDYVKKAPQVDEILDK